MRRLKELEQENARLRRAVSDLTLDKLILRGRRSGEPQVRAAKLISPSPRRETVARVCKALGVSERRTCRVLGQPRATPRRRPRAPDDEARLTADIVELATVYGRYGHRRIAALLRQAGWAVKEAGRAHLAARGAQGAEEAAEAGPAPARRWILRPAATGAA